MKFPVIVEPEAESDIRAAVEWYESQVPGLGHEFLVSVRSCLGRLEREPELYAQVLNQIRRARLERFPFGVFYVCQDESVYVLGVFHYKRNPTSWIKRVRLGGGT